MGSGGSLGGIGIGDSLSGPEAILYTGDPTNASFVSGRPTVYANGTSLPDVEAGKITDIEGASGIAFWYNQTGMLWWTTGGTYALYSDAACTKPVKLIDTAAPLGGGSWAWGDTMTSSLGLAALVTGLMLFVAILGARFLTYGQSEFGIQAIWKGTGLGIVWGVFSVLTLPLMHDVPLNIFYFVLTAMYTIGIILHIGTGSSNE